VSVPRIRTLGFNDDGHFASMAARPSSTQSTHLKPLRSKASQNPRGGSAEPYALHNALPCPGW